MSVRISCRLAALAFALALVGPARAQVAPPPVDTAIVSIRLADGTELIGRVVARGDSGITVLGSSGVRTIVPPGALRSWRRIRGEMDGGVFRPADPNTSRLFFGPTARTLHRGEGYFADYYLFFPMAGYGISDAVTIAGGISIFPGASGQIIYLAPKVRVAHRRGLDASVGGILFTTTDASGQAGVAYGALTLGNENNALTVVGGFGEADGHWSARPAFLIGGETRIGRGVKLIGEVWAFPASTSSPRSGASGSSAAGWRWISG